MLLVKRHSLLLASGRMLLNIWYLSVSVHAIIELCVKVTHSCLTVCNPMDYTVQGILQPSILELGSFSLLQGIFPTQGSNPSVPCCRQILYQLSHKESPRILEWVAYPFSSIFQTQELNWGLLHSRTRILLRMKKDSRRKKK